eukprot:CAMPEP_0202017698 /NCGR_PEP_ID=MMETSP0905-20130828/37714_1 /ASSEMBLY_ACC=CAM_ASM_000554 /TAXON_ID=420261 /ORGANISM="Thalassiosira antarctica, Strain CCMP982" /LENGTH=32 /DNA_ID= /DNA_START= /DNA_END= /DNA_ORIENTATION=
MRGGTWLTPFPISKMEAPADPPAGPPVYVMSK